LLIIYHDLSPTIDGQLFGAYSANPELEPTEIGPAVSANADRQAYQKRIHLMGNAPGDSLAKE